MPLRRWFDRLPVRPARPAVPPRARPRLEALEDRTLLNADLTWLRQFGTSGFEHVYGLAVDGAGNALVAGTTDGTLPGQTSADSHDAFVRAYDAAGNELWTRQFGAGAFDFAFGAAADGGGNFYVAGRVSGALPGQTSAGGADAYLRKYDAAGNELWTRQFGSANTDSVGDVAVDGAGNVYVVGAALAALPGQTYAGVYDVFVRKYSADGNEVWTRQFGTSNYDDALDVAVDGAGNVFVAGNTYGTLAGQASAGSADAFVRKFDAAGNHLWTRQFGSPREEFDVSVAADGAGNVFVAGDTVGTLPGQASAGGKDAYLRKVDAAGNVVWTRQFGTAGDDSANGVAVDAAGNVLVGGAAAKPLPGQTAAGAFVRMYDAAGNDLWTRQFGSGTEDIANSVALDGAGNVYLAGRTRGTLPGQTSAGGTSDAFVAKLYAGRPANIVPATRALYRNGSLALALKVHAPDAGDGALRATVKASTGRLYVASYSGLTSATGYGTATLTLTGPRTALNAALARLTYRPNIGFVGSVRIYLSTNDQGNNRTGLTLTDSDSFLVRVVNRKPLRSTIYARATTYRTPANRALYVSAPVGLLRAFRDPDGDRLTIQLVRRPSVGTLRLSTSGGFSYVPPRNFKGKVTFVVRAFDGNLYSNFATVTLTVF